ncbi:YfhO family protein [Candidatus Micrarchaeota archaeon]|nr:YfhO family protein [Patescibacteria group bacterium]MBU1930894.1 YfhO family protein [Candidatus Micrarchaeota archaeon]
MKNLKKKWLSWYKNRSELQRFLNRSWPLVVILAISVVFFYPVWLQGKDALPTDALVGAHTPWIEVDWGYPAGVPIKNQEITDAISQFYPWRSLVGEFWRAGKVPLWNPYMFSGTPFLATLHSATLYPLNAVYLFMNNINAWNTLVFFQILLAGIFMYLFLRELGLKKEARIFGAIAFAFSGYMIAWLEFATGGHAGLWLPLLLLLELKLIKTQKRQWLIPIAMTFFCVFTAGDFQVPLYIIATYFLFGLFLMNKSSKTKSKNFFKIIAGFIFGIFLSLPQLLPTLELFSNSIRQTDPYIAEYFYGLMHWKKITNFIWPDFFGNVVTRNYWAEHGYHEYLAFGGITTLCFSTYSFFSKKLKFETFFWLLFLGSLLFLFPTPIAFLPFKLKIPALGTSSASRIIFLTDFCLAVLGAHGLSKWMEKKDSRILRVIFWFLTITFGVALGLIISIYLMSGGVGVQMLVNSKVALRNMIPSTLVLIASGFLFFCWLIVFAKLNLKNFRKRFLCLLPIGILILFSAEMLRFAWKNTPFSPREFLFPRTETIEFLQKEDEPFRMVGRGIPLNYFMQYDIPSAEGYDPIYPLINGEWFSLVNFGHTDNPSRRYGQVHSFSSSLLNYANIKYVVEYKRNSRGELADDGEYVQDLQREQFEEVFLEGRVGIFQNKESLPRIWMTSTDIRDEVMGRSLTPDDLEYIIDSITFYPNEVETRVNSSSDAFLFLSESYYPGWKAFVDDEQVEIQRVNYLFQAITVPAGKHRIRFIYDPLSFRIGSRVTLVTLVFLIGLVLYEQKIDKSKKSS